MGAGTRVKTQNQTSIVVPHFLPCHADWENIYQKYIYQSLTRTVPITVPPDTSTCSHPEHPRHSSPTVHVSSRPSALHIGLAGFDFPTRSIGHSRAESQRTWPIWLTSSKTRHVAISSHRSRSIPPWRSTWIPIKRESLQRSVFADFVLCYFYFKRLSLILGFRTF